MLIFAFALEGGHWPWWLRNSGSCSPKGKLPPSSTWLPLGNGHWRLSSMNHSNCWWAFILQSLTGTSILNPAQLEMVPTEQNKRWVHLGQALKWNSVVAGTQLHQGSTSVSPPCYAMLFRLPCIPVRKWSFCSVVTWASLNIRVKRNAFDARMERQLKPWGLSEEVSHKIRNVSTKL